MALRLACVAVALGSASAFHLGAPVRPGIRRASARLDASEEGPDLEQAVADVEEARAAAESVDLTDEEAVRQSYIELERAKTKENLANMGLGSFSFDFSGNQSIPTPVRGEDGLNEQGFGAAPEQSSTLPIIPLAIALVGIGALTVVNQV